MAAVQEARREVDRVTDESLESTRRIVALSNEAHDVGAKTAVMLDEQGEKLDRVDRDVDLINEDMRQADRKLRKLATCCGLCLCPWQRRRNYEKSEAYKAAWKSDGEEKADTGRLRRAVDGKGAFVPTSGYITRVTNDAREDEMEQNLATTHTTVSRLKYMAIDMGAEIDRQNKQLDRIVPKVIANTDRVDDATKYTNYLLTQ